MGRIAFLQPSKVMSEKPEKLNMVLPGLQAGQPGCIVSPGGIGKSALALQLASQVAGCRDILGIGTVKPGRAVYLAGEDNEATISHRLFALGERLTPNERETLDDRLFVAGLSSHSPDIMDDGWYDEILASSEGARLVIVDTLRIFHRLDENSSGDMAQVIGRFKQMAASTGAAVVFLHHASKSATWNDYGDETGASRGSSVITDNVRWVAYLQGMSKEIAKRLGVDEDCRGQFCKFGVAKKVAGQPLQPYWLRKVSATAKDVEGGFVMEPATLPDAKMNGRSTREKA